MKSSDRRFTAAIIIGALLALGPIFGFLGTFYGMTRASSTLQDPGITDPHALAQGVSIAIYSSAVGLVVCPIGAIILVVSLVLRARVRRGKPAPPL